MLKPPLALFWGHIQYKQGSVPDPSKIMRIHRIWARTSDRLVSKWAAFQTTVQYMTFSLLPTETRGEIRNESRKKRDNKNCRREQKKF